MQQIQDCEGAIFVHFSKQGFAMYNVEIISQSRARAEAPEYHAINTNIIYYVTYMLYSSTVKVDHSVWKR